MLADSLPFPIYTLRKCSSSVAETLQKHAKQMAVETEKRRKMRILEQQKVIFHRLYSLKNRKTVKPVAEHISPRKEPVIVEKHSSTPQKASRSLLNAVASLSNEDVLPLQTSPNYVYEQLGNKGRRLKTAKPKHVELSFRTDDPNAQNYFSNGPPVYKPSPPIPRKVVVKNAPNNHIPTLNVPSEGIKLEQIENYVIVDGRYISIFPPHYVPQTLNSQVGLFDKEEPELDQDLNSNALLATDFYLHKQRRAKHNKTVGEESCRNSVSSVSGVETPQAATRSALSNKCNAQTFVNKTILSPSNGEYNMKKMEMSGSALRGALKQVSNNSWLKGINHPRVAESRTPRQRLVGIDDD